MTVKFDDLNPLRSWDTKFRDFRETGPRSREAYLNQMLVISWNRSPTPAVNIVRMLKQIFKSFVLALKCP